VNVSGSRGGVQTDGVPGVGEAMDQVQSAYHSVQIYYDISLQCTFVKYYKRLFSRSLMATLRMHIYGNVQLFRIEQSLVEA
jgi:hypothetical protein